MAYLEQLFLHLSQNIKEPAWRRGSLFMVLLFVVCGAKWLLIYVCWLRWSCVIIMKWLPGVCPHPPKQRWMSVGDALVSSSKRSCCLSCQMIHQRFKKSVIFLNDCFINAWRLRCCLFHNVVGIPWLWQKTFKQTSFMFSFFMPIMKYFEGGWDWKGWAGHQSQAPIV